MASRNSVVLAKRGKFGVSTVPYKMNPREQSTEPKLLILVSSFSGEVTSYVYTLIPVLLPHNVGSMPFRFFLGHPEY